MSRPGSVKLLGWLLLLVITPAAADTYPSRPVAIFTPFAAGNSGKLSYGVGNSTG
jgi:tripartite-type tricarboxylate transporter receptor subunit TctC